MNEQQSAFPTSGLEYTDKGRSWAQAGMTLRDYFAAKALQTILARKSDYVEASKLAYLAADAMMEVRSAA